MRKWLIGTVCLLMLSPSVLMAADGDAVIEGKTVTSTAQFIPATALPDAAADGSTKGVSAFTAADFNDASGVISIDYANGTAASAGAKGFLTAADWSTFNGKQAAITDSLSVGTDDTADAVVHLYGDDADTGPTLYFHNSANEDGTEEYWVMEPQGTNFWFGAVSDPDQFIFSNAGNFTAAGNVAGATYGSDASISDAELKTIDDGATTEIPVGGGAGSAMVWTTATGTGAPVRATSPTITTPIINTGVGVGTASPLYTAVVAAPGSTSSTLQLNTEDPYDNSGFFFTTQDTGNGFVSAGASFDSAAWTSRSATSWIFGGGSAGITWYYDTGKTPGAGLSPTSQFKISADGEIFAYNMDAASGSYPVEFNTSTKELTYDTSSSRFKENIRGWDGDYYKLLLAAPRIYNNRKTGDEHLGMIAEELDKLGLTQLVGYGPTGAPTGVKYKYLAIYLLELLKDLYYKELPVKKQEQLRREDWKAQWIMEHRTEVEVDKSEALEPYQDEVTDELAEPIGHETRYSLKPDGMVNVWEEPIFPKSTVTRYALKKLTRFDKKTGRFFKEVYPSEAEAEAAAAEQFVFTSRTWGDKNIEVKEVKNGTE